MKNNLYYRVSSLLCLAITYVYPLSAQEPPPQIERFSVISSGTISRSSTNYETLYILGEADSLLLILTNSMRSLRKNKYRVEGYDITDMKQVYNKPLFSSQLQKKYERLFVVQYKTGDSGLVFLLCNRNNKYSGWNKKKIKERSYYIATYTPQLDRTSGPNKLETLKKKDTRDLFLISDANAKRFGLIKITPSKKNEHPDLEYSIFNNRFELQKRGSVTYPFYGTDNQKYNDALKSLYLTPRGSIVSSFNIFPKEISIADQPKYSSMFNGKYHQIFHAITDDKQPVITNILISEPQRRMINYMYSIKGSEVLISGFYSDLDKDKKGKEIHGVFRQKYNVETGEKQNEQLAALPSDFFTTVNKQNTLLSERKKKKENENESISESIDIIETFYDDESGTTTIYAEAVKNYDNALFSNTILQRNETMHYIKRGSIFRLEVDKDGNISPPFIIRRYFKKSSNTERIYSATTATVLRLEREKKDYVYFNTQKVYNPKNPSDLEGSNILLQKFPASFMCLTYDYRNGTSEYFLPEKPGPKFSSKHSAKIENIGQYNKHLYTYSHTLALKWPYYFLGPAAAFPAMSNFLINWPLMLKEKITLYHIAPPLKE